METHEEQYGEEKDRLMKALDSMIYLPHLKEQGSHMEVGGGYVVSPRGDRKLGGIARPWDRRDLYERLQTYKPATWFGKGESVNAPECARRGWRNTGEDQLACEVCYWMLWVYTCELACVMMYCVVLID